MPNTIDNKDKSNSGALKQYFGEAAALSSKIEISDPIAFKRLFSVEKRSDGVRSIKSREPADPEIALAKIQRGEFDFELSVNAGAHAPNPIAIERSTFLDSLADFGVSDESTIKAAAELLHRFDNDPKSKQKISEIIMAIAEGSGKDVGLFCSIMDKLAVQGKISAAARFVENMLEPYDEDMPFLAIENAKGITKLVEFIYKNNFSDEFFTLAEHRMEEIGWILDNALSLLGDSKEMQVLTWELLTLGKHNDNRYNYAIRELNSCIENFDINEDALKYLIFNYIKSGEFKEFSKNEAFAELSSSFLETFGMVDLKMLTSEERMHLLRRLVEYKREGDRSSIEDMVDDVNRFIKRRKNGFEDNGQFEGFNLSTLRSTTERGVIVLKEDGSRKLKTRNEIIAALVIGLDGSTDNAEYEIHKRALWELIGREKLGRAINAWKDVKRTYSSKLREEYSRFLESGDEYLANRVIDVIAAGAKDVNPKKRFEREALGDIISFMRGAIRHNEIYQGDHIVVYTTKGKDNIICIESAEVGACTFLGGESEHMAIRYALDPAIVLVNFSVAKTPLNTELQGLKVNGVAIGSLGAISVDGDKHNVLHFNSLEGGIKLRNAMNGKEGEILEVLKNISKEIGATYISFGRDAFNETAMEFFESVEGDILEVDLKLYAKEAIGSFEGYRIDVDTLEPRDTTFVKLMRV